MGPAQTRHVHDLVWLETLLISSGPSFPLSLLRGRAPYLAHEQLEGRDDIPPLHQVVLVPGGLEEVHHALHQLWPQRIPALAPHHCRCTDVIPLGQRTVPPPH